MRDFGNGDSFRGGDHPCCKRIDWNHYYYCCCCYMKICSYTSCKTTDWNRNCETSHSRSPKVRGFSHVFSLT
jgi:hypothetical protein